jgi:hypothetical protein
MMRARARVERRARQESERVDPACRRLGEISSRRRRDCGLACGGAGAMRGADASAVAERGRRVDGILTRSPIQSVRTSPSPVVAPFADILAAASQTPVANEDASTRATFISVSPCFGRWHERVGADRESARAEDVDAIEMARSRVRAPKMRRPRAPLECPSAGRPRLPKAAREAVRRRTTKAPLDSFRRHRTGGDDPCVGGSDCLSREFENFRFADSRVPRVFFSRRC